MAEHFVLVYCARHVSGIIFIRYSRSQNIGISNKLKRLGGWGARSITEFEKIMTYNETHVL
jgi:hypothetical protein